MNGISRKIYLEPEAPTEEDNRSDQKRIEEELKVRGVDATMTWQAMKKLYPLCEKADWKITVSLAWDEKNWKVVDLEAGDRSGEHYGVAVDLGSTTVAVRLVDCNTGKILGEVSTFNGQIPYGTDILTRIFHCQEDSKTLEVLRKAAADSITACVRELERQYQLPENSCIAMTIGGNTTMIHFLLGMDAFCVFHTPYAVHADRPGFLPARDLELPVKGYVYIYPARSNYLGGDIISGMVATGIYKKEKIHAFFDIGTNGELVLGNRDFLLCGAGAAGPALEGGVVKTGMRAMEGAVDRVKLKNGELHCHVIGETAAKGICGSGIVDLLAELFLHGWIDIRGVLQPEKSRKIMEKDGMLAVNYAPDLNFYQSDIEEFIRTKAAAYTMVAIMLRESGIELSELEGFYVAGAFGKHVSKESAIAIGMYPDMDRERIIHAGNSSLEGAVCALLDRNVTKEVEEILEKMVYIQFGAVEDFLNIMVAAQALPHTDIERYPTVKAKLESIRKQEQSADTEN